MVLISGAKNVTASIGYGLLVVFFIGGYAAWDAYVVLVIMLSPVLLDYTSNTFRMFIFTPVTLVAPPAGNKRANIRAHG